jgi:sugar lactone lactonase YvrE
VALDAAGNLYIADSANRRIRKIAVANGIITTVAGIGLCCYSGDGGAATAATLTPSGVALDFAGNLYIADYYNNRIRKVAAASGIITTVAGNGSNEFSGDGGTATAAGLLLPSGVALDFAGNLYIADGNDRIRKVAAASGIITTVAGNGSRGFSGDGGPATEAGIFVADVTLDSAGNLYIADANQRIRKVAAGSGIITTVAGNGSYGFSGDGGAATAAELYSPSGVVLDSSGNLYIADFNNDRIRKVTAGSGIITTVAGNGSEAFRGDGGAATAAKLDAPFGVAVDPTGNLYIADTHNNRIRKVAAGSGIITTVAGNGSYGFSGDGGAATAAGLLLPQGVALDLAGNLYISDSGNSRIRKVAAGSGIITTVAGNGIGAFSGDGAAATAAGMSVASVALDSAGNLYIADNKSNRVRKVAAGSGVITTVAGNGFIDEFGSGGFSGDGGPATEAGLNLPYGVAVDSTGNLYIGDTYNHRVRKVAAGSGIITTAAGNGTPVFSGDGGAATEAELYLPQGVALDAAGNLYIVDRYNHRIRKVAAGSGIITTIAGNGSDGFTGDGGAATAAGLSATSDVFFADIEQSGLAVDTIGNLYIAEIKSDRIRAVFACVTVPAPNLQQPSNAETSVLTSPRLAWKPAKGALRYDVYLDTANPPQKVVASDITAPTYSPANLEPLKQYYWKVVAKGDPFCTPFSTSTSDVLSFTTTGSCSVPGPLSGAVSTTGTGATITWQPSVRANSYDLYLGTTIPPRLYAPNLPGTSQTVSGLAGGTTYNWKVVAHANCDPARTSETTIASFVTPGSCAGAAPLTLTTPSDGDGTVSGSPTLSWAPTSGAASYDLYLGSGSSPPLYLSGVEGTSVMVPGLSAGVAYSWKVVANAACDATKSNTSAVRHFSVASCGVPSVPQNVVVPQPAVTAGATYSIRWSEAAGLDAGGGYLVERSADASFAGLADQQETTSASASFTTESPATYYHRVRSIAGCDRSKRSAPAVAATAVTVGSGEPIVVFTVLPGSVITKLGDKLEDQKTSFALENLGTATVQVQVSQQLGGPAPFFMIIDPFGGDPSSITLEPRRPKGLDVHFSGPANDQSASYQGVILVTSTGLPLAFTPRAYVNLKVGADANAVAPSVLVNGLVSEFAWFPPVTGDDSGRPAIEVDLQNIGSVPMDVAGEIGPEGWLKMEKDWNTLPVPASAFRTLLLSTQRMAALPGSALPRYTYLTVRNKAGAAARLLVEDSGGITNTTGRSAPLGAGEMSVLVPYVASGTAVFVTNSGSDPVPVDLVYTPEGSDGFDAATVLRASIVIPPNDVVSLTDPLVQIFGKSSDATGSVEIRSAKLAQLAIRAEGRKAANGGGVYTTLMPVAMRGEGSRIDSPHRLAGITSSGDTKTSLIMTETSGREKTTAHIALYDNSGTRRGEQTIDLGRYGTKRIDDIAQALTGGASVTAARIDVDVPSGGGAVLALAIVTDRTSGAGAAIIGRATAPEVHLSSLGRPIHAEITTTAFPQTFIIPGAITNSTLKTTVGVSALASAVNATVALRASTTGQTIRQTTSIAAGQTSEVDIPTGAGTVMVTADAPVSIYARVRGTNIADALPIVSTYSEGLTGGGSAIPLYADGLEHSIDATRGRKTSLILTELAGQSATVNVRLYEPGSRTAAVAEKDFTISANSELRLDNLFVSMGMESSPDDLDQRRKNQISVAAVVTATSGSGVIAAQAVMTDNKTGDRRTIVLVPAGGVPATTAQRSLTNTPLPARRRAVGK